MNFHAADVELDIIKGAEGKLLPPCLLRCIWIQTRAPTFPPERQYFSISFCQRLATKFWPREWSPSRFRLLLLKIIPTWRAEKLLKLAIKIQIDLTPKFHVLDLTRTHKISFCQQLTRKYAKLKLIIFFLLDIPKSKGMRNYSSMSTTIKYHGSFSKFNFFVISHKFLIILTLMNHVHWSFLFTLIFLSLLKWNSINDVFKNKVKLF